MPVMLVSFCNVFPPGLALGLYDFDTSGFQWLDLAPAGDDVRGVTGITFHEGRYWCLAQIYRPGWGLVSLDEQFRVVDVYELGRLREAHSMISFEDGLLIAETGRNRLVWVETPRQGKEPRVEEYWRYTDQDSDVVHLNAVAHQDDQIYVSIFGERPEDGWKQVRVGQIINVTRNEVVVDHQAQPHSLMTVGDDLLWLESATGLVHRRSGSGTQEVVAKLDGFVRGLAATENNLYVAASMARRRSRSMGTANAPPARPSDTHSWLYRLDRDGTSLDSRKLSSIGAEIYELVLVPGVDHLDVEAGVDPVVQRIWRCEDEYNRLGDRLRLDLFQKSGTIQVLARSIVETRRELRELLVNQVDREAGLKRLEERLDEVADYVGDLEGNPGGPDD